MRRPSIPALTLLLLCGAVEAAAQSFTGLGPAVPRILPQPGGDGRAADAPAPAPSPRAPSLRRPTSTTAPLRIWGENGAITWTLYATEAEARAGGTFQVGYLAGISVLPEASSLSLAFDGKILGTAAIDGARGSQTLRVAIPPRLLAPGYNALRLSVVQRHRVDCSVAATFELWTQVDPETTGFSTLADRFTDPADLAAARVAADGSVPIRLVQTGDRLSGPAVERLLGAVQGVVLAGRMMQPAVDFGPVPEGGDGLALAVAPAAELAGTLDLAGLGPITGPRLALLPGTPARRPVLVATGASEADVAEAVSRLGRLHAQAPRGTPGGLQALADSQGRRIEGAQSLTLADLGFADAHVTARTYRVAFDLALPHDILPADYDKVVLDIDAQYPAGLAAGAQFMVSINGTDAASAQLGRPGGETLTRRAVFLPLGLMRPGLNRIAITAELPRPEDRTCALDGGAEAERLTVFATTRLTIPPLARISRQPELAETLSAGFPYAEGTRRPTLRVPTPDRDTMAAAATLVARLGLAAGRPIPFAFAAGRSTGGTGPALIVSAVPALDAPLLAGLGLDAQALKASWSQREPAPAARDATPLQRRAILRRDGIAACRGRAGAPSAPKDGFDGASAILAQGLSGPASDEIVTLVGAASAADLREAVDCLVHPRIWNRPQGRLALLSAADGAVSSSAAESPRYVATAPASPMNLRRIAAGWLSVHAGLYGLFALLVAGSLAGSTRLLVRNLGRKST